MRAGHRLGLMSTWVIVGKKMNFIILHVHFCCGAINRLGRRPSAVQMGVSEQAQWAQRVALAQPPAQPHQLASSVVCQCQYSSKDKVKPSWLVPYNNVGLIS